MNKTISIQLLLAVFTLPVLTSFGQINDSIVNFIPKPPEASMIEQYGNLTVNSATGVPDITIPLHTINYDGVSIPISISYLANGIMVNDISSPVGLKWALNAGGSISRNIIGKPDENQGGWFSYDPNFVNINTCDLNKLSFFYDGSKEATPDVFSYSVGGYNGGFFFSLDKQIIKSKGQELKIHTTNPEEHKYTITDKNGIKYFFYNPQTLNSFDETTLIEIQYSRREDVQSIENNGSGITSWKLNQILTPRGKTISFDYEDYSYQTPFYFTSYNYSKGVASCDGLPIPSSRMSKTKILYEYNTRQISSIETEYEKVMFYYSLDESLSIMKKKLNRIEVIQKANNNKKIIDFIYDKYLGDPRLKLIGVNVYGLDSRNIMTDTLKYVFNYEESSLPVIGSTCQDVFGFINDNSINHLIPVDNYNLIGFPYSPANREISSTSIIKGNLIEIHYPTGGKTRFTFEPNSFLNSTGFKYFFPGVRIKTIKDIDSDGKTYNEKMFEYFEPYSNNPHIENDFNNYFENDELSEPKKYKFKKWSSNPFPRFVSDFNGFFYKKVKTFSTINGTLIEEYDEYLDIFTYQPSISSRIVLNTNHNPVKKTSYSYYTSIPPSTVVEGLKTTESYTLCGEYYCNGFIISQSQPQFETYPIIFKPLRYYFYSGLEHFPVETIEKEYFYNGALVDSITTIDSISYNNDFLISRTSKSRISDDGIRLSIIKESVIYKYPNDYTINSSTAFIQDLITNEIFGLPIDISKVKVIDNQEKLLEGKVFEYNSVGLPKKVYYWRGKVPKNTNWSRESLFFDNNYQKEIELNYDSYDNNYSIIESLSYDSLWSSYIWGYNNQYSIAKVVNSRYDVTAYTSFETNDDKGGWSYSSTSTNFDGAIARTGTRSYKIYSGNKITRLLAKNTTYELSYWLKGDTVTTTGGTITYLSQPSPDPDVWVHYRKKVVVGSSDVTLNILWASGTSVRLDELRLHPIDAQMETYTYDPGLGVTSITDANGRTTRYEYDGLGRLLRVLDEDGNILQEHEYHYAE